MKLDRISFFLAIVLAAYALAGQAYGGFPAPGPGAQAPAADRRAAKPGVFQHLSSAAGAKKFSEDSIIVKFKPGATDAKKDDLHKRHGSKIAKKFDRLRMHHVKLKKGKAVEDALKEYRADPDVEYAEPDYVMKVQASPSDEFFGSLWGMNKINAPAAWDISTGSGSVVVAVIDTGIDYSHPDLSANIWVNPRETAGNGYDDDGNGYPDDIHGIDTFNSDSDPFDDHYHGTHVAGTIGAVGNNGAGVAGVNWNVKIMACKAFGSDGSGSISAIIGCLEYVKLMKDRGVNIVATNNSWGGAGYSQALYDAIALQPEILFIAAAGNDATNIDKGEFYPGGYDLSNIITVAATDSDDNLAGFSNTGDKSVHVGAPGTSIYSTAPGNAYQYLQGTSMATPHVTGLAALLSSTGKNWKQVKNLILSGGVPVQALAGKTITGSRIDAFNSIACSNRPLLVAQHLPARVVAGVPITLSVISINCGTPVGPVTVTLPGGGTMQLLDGGVAPDKVSGDGVFTGSWTPPGSGSYSFTITTPAASRSVVVPPVSVSFTATAAPPATVSDATVYAGLGENFSLSFSTTGGILPYSWSVASGTLPPGLSLNSATGEISGVTGGAGVYPLTLRVTDSLGISDSGSWTLVLNQGTRPGWPKTLVKRSEDYLSITSSPVFADLDGDGKQEIIVADLNAVYVFNESSLVAKYNFPPEVVISSSPAVADLFNDGRKQIIVSAGWPSLTAPIYVFDKTLNLLPGFPAGAFPTLNSSPGFVSSPVVADLNGDGKNTILVVCAPNNDHDGNYGKNVLVMVDPQGAVVPGWPVVSGAFSFPGNSQPAVADLDKDGKKEIVLLGGDGVLRIFHKDGNQIAGWVPVANGLSAWSPVLADFNGDGFLDIAVKQIHEVSGTYLQRVSVFDRTGRPLPGWPKDAEYNPNLQIIAADLDGDGSAELVASTGGPNWTGLTAYKGDGTTVPNWPVPSSNGWLSVNAAPVAGDLTGSGGQDILYSTFGMSGTFLWGYSGSGAPLYGYPKNATLQAEVRTSPALGDLDGNGRVDIAVKANDGTLHVWEAEEALPSLNLQWPMSGHDAQHTGTLPVASGANFSASPLSGTAPLLVSFTDSSTSSPVTWSWSFGDGAVSTQRNPQHSYTAPGSYSVTLTAAGPQGSATRTRAALITVTGPLALTSAELPAAVAGESYSQMLTATGGTSPYSWSVSAGNLPSGLALGASTGMISGTPAGAGSASFTIQVTDAVGASALKPLSLTVNTPLAIATVSFPNAWRGVDYSQTLVATGGQPPYTWSVLSGSLPTGMTLNGSTGEISGAAILSGTGFEIKVTDAGGHSATKPLNIGVNYYSHITIMTATTLPGGTAGASYSQKLVASGVPPYTWAFAENTPTASGGLPEGLSLDSATGTISGVPALPGAYVIYPQVTEASGEWASKRLQISVRDACGNTMLRSVDATGVATPFGTFGSMYNDMPGTRMQLRAGGYSGHMNLTKDLQVSLEGGYNCDYSSNEGSSQIIAGALKVSNGTVKIDKLRFR